jgi:hypothetical protein
MASEVTFDVSRCRFRAWRLKETRPRRRQWWGSIPSAESWWNFVLWVCCAPPANEPGLVDFGPRCAESSDGWSAVLSAARVAADGGPSPSNYDQSMWLIGLGPPPRRIQCQVRATGLCSPNSAKCLLMATRRPCGAGDRGGAGQGFLWRPSLAPPRGFMTRRGSDVSLQPLVRRLVRAPVRGSWRMV